MSVYVKISSDELKELLSQYDIGHLISFSPLETGITNSNYKFVTDRGLFVLTLFEQLKADELPFYLELTRFFAEHGLPTAQPLRDVHGNYLHELGQRPAVINPFLTGSSPQQADVVQCRAVGDILARLHTTGLHFPQRNPNCRGGDWRQATAESLMAVLPTSDALLLQEEIGFHKTLDYSALPKGIIHADLFPDNVLFSHQTITGVIDFYYACYDYLLLDLAITVNAWCQDEQGRFAEDKITALVSAYENIRPLTGLEHEYWPAMRRTAALRFWLSRLQDFHYPAAGEQVQVKNPDEYKAILQQLSTIPKF